MSKLQPHRHAGDRGFTVLEVLVAIFILTVGMVSVAALAATMMNTSNRSKYMSLEASLASEKLEDLNHWSARAVQVCMPTGSTSVGSLTSDVLQNTTCPGAGGASDTVAYYDDVSVNFSNNSADCPSSTGGCFAETVADQVGGTTQYSTTYHSPDGRVLQGTSTTAPPNMTFHRRWIIEADSPVADVRRITVRVTLNNVNVQPNNISFQMSLVRP
jgi:type II secretory pathway component PulJ